MENKNTTGVYHTLVLNDYNDYELQILGKRFCIIFQKHIAMAKYQTTGLKVFDFTLSEFSELALYNVEFVEGITKGRNSKDYKKNIVDYLTFVDTINPKQVPNSISKDFKQAIRNEVKKFILNVKEQPNYWNV